MKLKKRHAFMFGLLRLFVRPIFSIKFGYKAYKFKLEKDKPYLIISNHTAQVDPGYVMLSFNRPIYFVAHNSIMTRTGGKIVRFLVSPISKTKGQADVTTIRESVSVVKQNGVVGLFPSGDCTYTGVESPIGKQISKYVKLLNADLILYRTYGLFGCDPRFGRKSRKGKSYGQVEKVITKEEFNSMSNDELYEAITKVISCDQVIENTEKFESKNRAEWLERILYVCPDCYSLASLSTKGNEIKCCKCGYKAEYTEDLTFKIIRGNTEIKTIAEWDNFQKGLANTFINTNRIIVSDNIHHIEYDIKKGKRKKTIKAFKKGIISLYNDRIELYKDCNQIILPVKDVHLVFQGKRNLVIYYKDKTYAVYGMHPFNGKKYIEICDAIKTKFNSLN